jgi:hypothetical protein
MKSLLGITVFFFLFFTSSIWAASLHFNAQLVLENGEEQSAVNIFKAEIIKNKIVISDENLWVPIQPDDKFIQADGDFEVFLKDNIKPGEKVKLRIACDGWSIYAPHNGEFYVPNDPSEVIDVKLIANKSEVNVGQYSAKFMSTNVYVIDGIDSFYVQVFATQSLDKAIEVQNTLFERGFVNASIMDAHHIDQRDGLEKFYKIVMGPYESEKAAEYFMKKIKSQKPGGIFYDSFTIPWIKSSDK